MSDIGSYIQLAPVALAAGGLQPIPDGRRTIHLQFRRFAGCPSCNLQVHAFRRRQRELAAAQVLSLLVFPMVPRAEATADPGVALIADRDGRLARRFGVAAGLGAVLDPSAWPGFVTGLVRHGAGLPGSWAQAFRYPTDVLIGRDGALLAVQHAEHAAGAWSVDEVLHRVAAPLHHAAPPAQPIFRTNHPQESFA